MTAASLRHALRQHGGVLGQRRHRRRPRGAVLRGHLDFTNHDSRTSIFYSTSFQISSAGLNDNNKHKIHRHLRRNTMTWILYWKVSAQMLIIWDDAKECKDEKILEICGTGIIWFCDWGILWLIAFYDCFPNSRSQMPLSILLFYLILWLGLLDFMTIFLQILGEKATFLFFNYSCLRQFQLIMLAMLSKMSQTGGNPIFQLMILADANK